MITSSSNRPSTSAIAYVRVSTAKQDRSGCGGQAQRAGIQAYADVEGINIVEWFEDAASGAGTNNLEHRRGLQEALARAKSLCVPLMVWDVARLSRSKRTVLRILEKYPLLILISASEGGQVNRASLAALAARAEYEATQISDRTRRGLDRARGRGVRLGNPRNLQEAGRRGVATNVARKEKIIAEIADVLATIPDADGMTTEEVATILNGRGLRSGFGREWTVPALRRPLKLARMELTKQNEEERAAKEMAEHPLYGRF